MKEYGDELVNVDLTNYNTYGIKTMAKYVIKPFPDKLVNLLEYLEQEDIKWYILGSGSNVILPDKSFDGAIIKMDYFNVIKFKKNEVEVESGMLLSKFAKKLLDQGFTNFAFAISIPGTVGSAILGNVGCFGENIFDYVKDITLLDENRDVVTLTKDDIEYSYRYTEFKERNVIILKATLWIEKGNIDEAKEEIKKNLIIRKNTQPLEYKNAGSVFRNPKDDSAGRLIDVAGLKGLTIGGAKISEKHANFIINFKDAKSSDIIKLIEITKEKVKEKNKIELELEQIIVNW